MKNQDKISIGIPTYNRPDTLKKTLDSILAQSYQNFEIIISDNCSPDKRVADIISEYSRQDPRIKPFIQNENIGMVGNFTFVLRQATSDYFMWKSDDDFIEDQNFIEKLHDKLKNSDADFAFPECFYSNKNGSRTSILKNTYSNCKTRFEFLSAFTVSYSCLEFYGLYKMKNFNKKVDFEINDTVGCPDLLYIPKLFLNFNVIFVPDTYYVYNHVSSSDTFQRNLKLFSDRQTVMRDLITSFSAEEKLEPKERKIIVANVLNYYEFILKQEYSIRPLSRNKSKIINKMKLFLGKGKS